MEHELIYIYIYIIDISIVNCKYIFSQISHVFSKTHAGSLTLPLDFDLDQKTQAVQKLEELELKHIETNGQLLQLEQQTNSQLAKEKKISNANAPEKPLKDLEKMLGLSWCVCLVKIIYPPWN